MVNRKPTKLSRSRKAKKAPHLYRPTKGMRRQIRAYARFMPSIERFKEAPRITKAQLGLITKAKKRLRYTDNLLPLTEKQAKKLTDKSLIVGNGIRAVRLRNTASDAKIRVKKGNIIVASNGRTWEYHPVTADVDKLLDYGLAQLKRDDVQGIALWTDKGRANETFDFDKPWIQYLQSKVLRYLLLSDFLNGVAVLLKS